MESCLPFSSYILLHNHNTVQAASPHLHLQAACETKVSNLYNMIVSYQTVTGCKVPMNEAQRGEVGHAAGHVAGHAHELQRGETRSIAI